MTPPSPRPCRRRTSTPAMRHGAITAVICIALATVVAAMSSLNVALPDIARSTHATQTQLEWVIEAYSLVFAALLLPAGALGDKFGRRRALLVGLLIFGTGSALAMASNSANELIALRAMLGVGAALVMPATLSTITSTFPAEQRTKRRQRLGRRRRCKRDPRPALLRPAARGLVVAVGLRTQRRPGVASPCSAC